MNDTQPKPGAVESWRERALSVLGGGIGSFDDSEIIDYVDVLFSESDRESRAQALIALLIRCAGPSQGALFTREHYTALMLAADGSYLDERRRALAVEAVARLDALLPPEEP